MAGVAGARFMLRGLRMAGDHGHLDRGDLQVELVDDFASLQVDHHELLVLGVRHVGHGVRDLEDGAGLLPLLLLLPRFDGRDLDGDLTGLLVDDVELAVVGQHQGLALRPAGQGAEPVGGAQVHGLQ
ncbi:hypothetical protein ACFFX0_09775 [Citricoccus parietis]|uniref:Uncharacterized protein n=1 Tax=Citricoccus parietis TaxID=592307 RepID=A0ABV5FZ10_9MICC